MATVTAPVVIGPADHGRRMTLEEFVEAEWTEGWLYELARGVVEVSEVPGPKHGRVVWRLAELFLRYNFAHRGIIQYWSGGADCRLRMPGMPSDRHPDQAIYLSPEPEGPHVWRRWVPSLVVEVVSEGGEDRDYVAKRDEYLQAGVLEYWILDPSRRTMLILSRVNDAREEALLGEDVVHRTHLLPGLEAHVGELLGPP